MALGDYAETTYNSGSTPGISATRLNNNEEKTKELDTELTAHEAQTMPHKFTDATDLKTYKYGLKTNVAKDGLIFIYEEVL